MQYLNLLLKIVKAIFIGFAIVILSPIIIFMIVLQISYVAYSKAVGAKTIKVFDPIFGIMSFVPDKEEPYWETESIHFQPTDSQVSFLVNAGKSGSTKKQKEFYKDIEENYNHYFESVWFPFIQSEIDYTWFKEKHILIDDFKKSFIVESISIPRFRGKNMSGILLLLLHLMNIILPLK
jgi:TM2 domain-containing membrane protein YozV